MTLAHISYSQWNQWQQCPRAWWLGKVKKAEEKQTWYLPIGSAVHQMVEDYLKVEDPEDPHSALHPAEHYFYPLVAKQMEIEPDLSKWMSGGPKGAPVVGDKALQKVKDCFERALDHLDEVDVWEVEFDASDSLLGLSVPIKAYVDIIGEHKKHGPVILDWKTGRRKPKNNMQLFTYKALLGERFGVGVGLWAMLDPEAAKANPVNLSAVDPAEIGAKYQVVVDAINRQEFDAEKGWDCKMCFQSPNCMVESGMTQRTMYYGVPKEVLETPPY